MIILISAANADVCLSMARILKSHDFYKNARIIGLTPDSAWPARFYFDEVLNIPMASDPDYGAALEKIIAKVSPDFFIPFSEAELLWLSENFSGGLKTKLIINPQDVLKVFLDKKKTADFLREAGVNVPVTMNPSEVHDLPVIMKPRRSAGSKNMAVIRNKAQLEGFLRENSSNLDKYVAQELIDAPDAEFTCAIWRSGEALHYCTFRRTLQGGMTGFAKVEQHAEIDHALEKIANSLRGDIFINVQLRLRGEAPYIFEINPRFSSTVMMRHKIGFQDFIWTLDRGAGRLKAPLWKPPLGTMIYRVPEECVVKGGAE